jgi:hypothetical protein
MWLMLIHRLFLMPRLLWGERLLSSKGRRQGRKSRFLGPYRLSPIDQRLRDRIPPLRRLPLCVERNYRHNRTTA